MIFGWSKANKVRREKNKRANANKGITSALRPLIEFHNVFLPPFLHDLSAKITKSSWVALYGEEDFAKALFCDLCFNYIFPETGSVNPVLDADKVTYLGRSSTVGRTLLEHLRYGTKETSKEAILKAVTVLSPELLQHLPPVSSLGFLETDIIANKNLGEREFLEIAEANLLLQNRPAAIVDTTTDFYKQAISQGFRHSPQFLQSGKTIIWILDNLSNTLNLPLFDAKYSTIEKINFYFGHESPVGYIN